MRNIVHDLAGFLISPEDMLAGGILFTKKLMDHVQLAH
jgi:hypothetical protein